MTARWTVRCATLLLAVLLGGCGVLASLGLGGEPDEPEARDEGIAEVGGGRVMALYRPTSGLVHLSLWVDAGSREADPPQVATVAGWIAAGRAGDGVRARVLPDGIAYERMCERSRLTGCVEQLGRALGAREPTDDEVARTLRRLTDARRRAAADEGRTADALALEGLLGPGARGMRPLGDAEDDARIEVSAVARFLERTHGPSRALVVAAGDVRREVLADAAEALFEESPAAGAERVARGLEVDGRTPVVEVGGSDTVAVATPEPDLARAAALARAVAGATDGTVRPIVHAFEVRGGALVVARGSGDDAAAVAGELLFALHRARAEGLTPVPLALDDDPVTAARTAGMAWLAEGDVSGLDTAVGVGAVVNGGRADPPADAGSDVDPDERVRRRAVARLEAAARRARERVRPSTRGTVGERAASVVTDNGARIEVRRRPGDRRVAVAVRFAGGAAADPPALHGRAAVTATLASESCEGLGPGGLDARLAAMGATLAPAVDAGSWGVVIEAPGDRWTEALDLAIRCALRPELSRAAVERARIAVLDRLEGPAELASWAAEAVAEDAPGAVAPLGALEPVRDLPVAAVRRLHAESTVGARTSVAIVGDVPVEDAVARIARRVAPLDAGTAAPRAVPVERPPPDGPLAKRHGGATPRVVIAWRAPARDGDPASARAFAAAVAGTLDRTAGLRRVWSDGGARDGWAWAAVAVDASEEALAGLPERVPEAAAASEQATRRWRARERRVRARLGASPAVAADRLARGRLRGGEGADRGGGSTVAALRTAPPRFVVGRSR